MKKIKVLKSYKDTELERYVDVGEVLTISPKRFEEMLKREEEIGEKYFQEIKETRKARPSKK